MNDRTGWNIKGIHTRARDAAREAARQEGLSLGEYLNRLLSEESGSFRGRQVNETRSRSQSSASAAAMAQGYEEDDPMEALDRLMNRIEAVEARSTLAISGIDQSVVGLLKRLEQADQANSELGGHVDTLMEDIRATHNELRAAIERIEADDSSRRALEGMRAIEGALAKLADHVYAESEATQNETDAIKGRVEAGFADLGERVEGMEAAVNTRLKDADGRLERAIEGLEQRSQGAANHLADRFAALEQSMTARMQSAEAAIGDGDALNQRVEALESGMSEAIGNLEETLRGLQARLQTAESGTNAALQRLESTFSTLDSRIQAVAAETVKTGGDTLRKDVETRFESLAQDLRASIDRTRTELAGQIDAAATAANPAVFTALRADVDSLKVTIQESEQRHANALSVLTDRLDQSDASSRAHALEERLDQFTTTVDQRLTYVEAGVSGMGDANVIAMQDEVSKLSEAVTARIDGLEGRENQTVSRMGEQMTRLTDTLDQRIAESERNSATAIEQLGQTVANITRRMEARYTEALATVDQKLADAQSRQTARLDQVVEQVSARLDEFQAVSRENVSPVQRAIASLAARLDALESFNAPPFTDAAVEQEAFGGGGPSRPFVEAPDADKRPAETGTEKAPEANAESAVLDEDAPASDTTETEENELGELTAEPGQTGSDPLNIDDAEHAVSDQTNETVEPSGTPLPQLADADAFQGSPGLSAAPLRVSLRESLALVERARMEQAAAEADAEAVSADDENTAENVTDEITDDPFGAFGDDAHTVAEGDTAEAEALARETADADVFSDPPFAHDAETPSTPLPPPFAGDGDPSDAAEAPIEAQDDDADDIFDNQAETSSAAPVDHDIGRWDSLMSPEANEDFDTEPPSPDVTVGEYAEDFSGFEGFHGEAHAEDDGFDPISELENWSDADDEKSPRSNHNAGDDMLSSTVEAEGATDSGLFDTENAPPAPAPDTAESRDIPRPSLSEHAMPLDGDAAGDDYLKRARAAAIAAAEDAEPKKKDKRDRGNGAPRASMIALAAAVGITTAGTAGYLYLRGKQHPAPTSFSNEAQSGTASIATAANDAEAGPAAQPGTAAGALAALLDPVDEAATRADTGETSDDVAAALFDEEGSTSSDPIATDDQSQTGSDATLEPAAFTPTDPSTAVYPRIPAGRSITAAVEAGDPVAEFLHGQDLIADGAYAEGVALVEAAARDGIAAAQYRLAKLHERGLGVARDTTAARTWTERAAIGNNVNAMHDLAVFYAEGEGGEQNYAKAAEWFGKAAAFGVVDSQYNLAVLYERGLGVTENLEEAAFWFAAAERAGDSGAGARLATLREKMSPDVHAEAISRADRWQASEADRRANGIFDEKSWGFGAPNQVRAVQTALVAIGYGAVTPSGEIDRATSDAIAAYEEAFGLEVTGTLTPDLIRALNEGATNAS